MPSGRLRVIGGENRGFPLATPSGNKLRPTSNRVREALFDILVAHTPGARFLDLFAGTGAVGIEALSRGAEHCVFVEESRVALSCLRRNLEKCGMEDRSQILPGRIPAILSRLSPWAPFDLVFVDPPYERGLGEVALASSYLKRSLRPGSMVVLEHHRTRSPALACGSLLHRRSVRHGETVLSFYGLGRSLSEDVAQV